MTERPLTVGTEPIEGHTIRPLIWNGRCCSLLTGGTADAITAELDRLYAAAEANQAPGPDWKAKLREEVVDLETSAEETGLIEIANALGHVLALIDVLVLAEGER